MKNGFLGFSHLCVSVRDLERSLSLYRDVMGFEVLMQRDKEIPGLGLLHVVALGSPSGNMELVSIEGAQNRPVDAERKGKWHFSIKVENIEEAIDMLVDMGYDVRKDRIDTDTNWIGGCTVKSVHFTGPDGEALELEQFC